MIHPTPSPSIRSARARLGSASFAITLIGTASLCSAQSLESAASYDILILNDGKISIEEGNVWGQAGYSEGVDADKNKDEANYNGTLYVHTKVNKFKSEPGFTSGGGVIFTSGFDSELDQANVDANNYITYLGSLSSTSNFNDYKSKDDGAFSSTSTSSLTVLDFKKLEMEGLNFTLNGRSGFNDTFIIRTRNELLFSKGANVVLNNLDRRNVIWFHDTDKDFDLHKNDSALFEGTIIAPEGKTVLGEVDFRGSVIGGDEIKIGSGVRFQGTTTFIPEPSSSLLILTSLGGLVFARRKQS